MEGTIGFGVLGLGFRVVSVQCLSGKEHLHVFGCRLRVHKPSTL